MFCLVWLIQLNTATKRFINTAQCWDNRGTAACYYYQVIFVFAAPFGSFADLNSE